MGKTNDGMWNSPTHAMSDISSLAYRRNVPACGVIVPPEVAESSQMVAEPASSSNRNFQSHYADASWNKVDTGRGRGALLKNRDIIHRNDEELKKQLRLASGLGYSNEVIEAKFQNSSPARSLDEEETDEKVLAETVYDGDDLKLSSSDKNNIFNGGTTTVSEDEGCASPKNDELEEEEDLSIKENGDWNWGTRTENPAPNRVILKNVALLSFKRQKHKLAAKQAEATVPALVASPAKPDMPYAVAPMVKEDWRAEIKAEEARRSHVPEEASTKAKKGWRSEASKPLLGDLKIDANWSLFAPNVASPLFTPNVTTPPYAEDYSPTPDAGHQTGVEGTKSLVECLELPRGKKKGKKNKNVRIMYVPPAERLNPEPTVAPPGYLMPTNGVLPITIRNADCNPLAGKNIHRTFGNLFGQSIKQLGTNDRRPYQRSDSFSLANDDFPQLK